MDNRFPDRHATPRLPRTPTRRALIVGAAGLLVAAGSAELLVEAAAGRRVRKRHRNRNHNRSREKSISIPGDPGEPGEDGEP